MLNLTLAASAAAGGVAPAACTCATACSARVSAVVARSASCRARSAASRASRSWSCARCASLRDWRSCCFASPSSPLSCCNSLCRPRICRSIASIRSIGELCAAAAAGTTYVPIASSTLHFRQVPDLLPTSLLPLSGQRVSRQDYKMVDRCCSGSNILYSPSYSRDVFCPRSAPGLRRSTPERLVIPSGAASHFTELPRATPNRPRSISLRKRFVAAADSRSQGANG
jgi:hypothetical protein